MNTHSLDDNEWLVWLRNTHLAEHYQNSAYPLISNTVKKRQAHQKKDLDSAIKQRLKNRQPVSRKEATWHIYACIYSYTESPLLGYTYEEGDRYYN